MSKPRPPSPFSCWGSCWGKWALPPTFGVTFLALILLLATVERLSYWVTEEFSYPNITSPLPYHPLWEIEFPTALRDEASQALCQPFHYLTRGGQCFVFLSDDKRYIFKVFRHWQWRLPPYIDYLPLPQLLAIKREQWKKKREETLQDTFVSCAAACTLFREETAVVFAQLNPKERPLRIPEITLRDRLGGQCHLPLSKLSFVLQKAAIPTDQYLLMLKEKGDIEGVKKGIQELIHIIEKRARRGWNDKDPHLIRNFGFIDGKGIEVDIGGFYQDSHKDLLYHAHYERPLIYRQLIPWLTLHLPDLIPWVESVLLHSAPPPTSLGETPCP